MKHRSRLAMLVPAMAATFFGVRAFSTPPAASLPVPPPIRREQADAVVSNLLQLQNAFAAHKKIIWIDNNAQIDLSFINDHRPNPPDARVYIPDDTIIAGGRTATEPGGLIYDSRPNPVRYMLAMGNRTRITGLRLRGPSRSTASNQIQSAAILVKDVSNVIVDRNEMSDWPGAAVDVRGANNTFETAGQVRVTSNYIHHNLKCDDGYGVWVENEHSFAMVDRNLFDDDRHHVAGFGSPRSGYVAERNLVLSSGETCGNSYFGYYNQHFDMHGLGNGGYGGIAAETIQILRNSIRGAQSYYVTKTRPAFWLRGNPTNEAYFGDNVLAHDDQGDAIRTDGSHSPNLVLRNNRYGTDTSFELAVGDFDGDGYQDVFQATGGVWVYSPRGQREWQYLNYMPPYRTSELRFGDFDGDGKTDVFVHSGEAWLYSSGGTTALRPLPETSTISTDQYRFGNFLGDKRTDIFYTNGKEWFVSDGASKPWKSVGTSQLKLENLRFCDFNGDGRTDVFSFANGVWSVAFARDTEWTWQKINDNIGGSIDKLVFGDFTGDGVCDVATTNTATGSWLVSVDGRTGWRVMNTSPDGGVPFRVGVPNPHLYPLETMLIGDFNKDGHADALHYERYLQGGGNPTGPPGSVQYGLRFAMSDAGAAKVAPRTEANMR